MPTGLIRYQRAGHFHFVTFSCYGRQPHLGSAAARDRFERSLEAMRVRYDFVVAGYVVMPKLALLSKALQALKLSVAVQRSERPFWQVRYYDFNVYTSHKRSEKIEYMHRNPVKRGLVAEPADWTWSSYGHYRTGERFTVEIESECTAARRNRAAAETHVSEARHGAPDFEEG
jgi:putative transposase